MVSFEGKRVIISGGSRGIGLAIAKRLAADGASIAILAKTTEPHPKLPGTIYTAAEEIEQAGGKALPIVTDVRNEDEVKAAVSQAVDAFGGLDICINNASAISLTKTAKTEMKRFDLMFAVNVRATFMLSKECLPHLIEGDNPHILSISPPLDMQTKWFAPSVAYTMSKFGMSLWPHSVIATAAISNVVAGSIAFPHCRKPTIMADAAAVILSKDSQEFTGNFCVDDVLLAGEGVTDFSVYRVDPDKTLWSDFFVPDDIPEIEPVVMAMNPGA
jgi:citronellol/citronellal dehydrogenase